MAILDKLFVALDYKYDESKLKKFNSIVSKTIKLVKTLALSTIGLATATALLAIKFAKQIFEISRVARGYGLLRKELIAFQRVSERLTGESSTGEGLLDRLSKAARGLSIGEVDSGLISALGSLGLDYVEVLNSGSKEASLAIANAFRKANETTQQQFQAFGAFSNSDIDLFRGLTRALLLANAPTSASAIAAEKLNNAILDLKFKIVDLTTAFAVKLIPLFNNLISPLIKKVNEFTSEDIDRFFNEAIEQLKEIAKTLADVGRGLLKFLNFFGIGGEQLSQEEKVDRAKRFSQDFSGRSGKVILPKNIPGNVNQTNNVEIIVNSTAPANQVAKETVDLMQKGMGRLAEQLATDVN